MALLKYDSQNYFLSRKPLALPPDFSTSMKLSTAVVLVFEKNPPEITRTDKGFSVSASLAPGVLMQFYNASGLLTVPEFKSLKVTFSEKGCAFRTITAQRASVEGAERLRNGVEGMLIDMFYSGEGFDFDQTLLTTLVKTVPAVDSEFFTRQLVSGEVNLIFPEPIKGNLPPEV
ncbi:hypothetical protein DRN67_03130 [Candidatus Micrarchaeota archaeon]|nr:MAG: hypothetical protein DRN67_03130 [Candidatus Micrarchaeota archaeon]